MDIVKHYLEAFLELGENEFLKGYDHPFLLYPEKQVPGGFATYHTRMADRGAGARIAGSGTEIKKFKVLPPNPNHGKDFPRKLLVGRGEDRDLTIDHSTVSKRHAFIAYDDEKQAYKLGDAGSTNGTFVNGHSVESGDPVYIRDGNIVSFGECDYMFFSPQGFVDLLKRLKSEEE